jgi:hypothetical protein
VASKRQLEIQRWIDSREARLFESVRKAAGVVRHKCFISFHQADEDEVVHFIETFEEVFIPRVLGVSDEDEFVDSSDTNYVLRAIREKYLIDSTVTIVLVGKCTWARRYVDWEVYSTLRNDPVNRRSGLMAVTLPSAANYEGKKLPPRVQDNVRGAKGDEGYARWWKYPTSGESLRSEIASAFDARTSRADLIDNSRERKLNNSPCP